MMMLRRTSYDVDIKMYFSIQKREHNWKYSLREWESDAMKNEKQQISIGR